MCKDYCIKYVTTDLVLMRVASSVISDRVTPADFVSALSFTPMASLQMEIFLSKLVSELYQLVQCVRLLIRWSVLDLKWFGRVFKYLSAMSCSMQPV